MASLYLRSFQIMPGHQENVGVTGDYVRIQRAVVPVWVETENGDKFQLEEGEEAQIMRFRNLLISHDDVADQNVRIFVGDAARVGSAKLSGNVSVVNALDQHQCSAANSQKTVTAVAANILPANPNRALLIVQNKHNVGTIYIAFGGVATVGNGYEIAPGEALELAGGIVPVGAVSAIGDAANNAAVVVVEGDF